jgi:hypothetical protein
MPTSVPSGNDGRRGRYLRRNHTDHTPAAILVIDTEARRDQGPDGEIQRLRLWCARYVQRREVKKMPARDDRSWGSDGASLAQLADRCGRGIAHIWCYTHNLGYDLQTSGLLEHLAVLGWSVSSVSSVSRYLWLTMARHSRACHKHPAFVSDSDAKPKKCKCPVIHFCDTVHMWPMKLQAIGDLLGTPKLPMPPDDADESQWVQYCMRDVDVTTDALLITMDYWDENKLGRWAITNAATAFNTLRHTLPGKPPVLIDDPEGSLWDRASIYGGRRQCWRHGDLPPGRYSEIDFTAAYATVGAHWPLPFKRGSWFDSLPVNDYRVDHPMISCIAECDIDTDVARFPVRVNGAVDYPIGKFTTVLAGPDIAWARELGCLRRIGRGQWHLLGTGYQPFFRRVLDLGRPGESAIPPIVASVWKQAGRTAIGKFSQHGYQTEDTGMLTDKVLFYEQEIDAESGEHRALIHYGGRIWRASQSGDGTYAYPAVTAFVESRVRVALGKAAEIIGSNAMVLCDTDGLWCSTSAIMAGKVGEQASFLRDCQPAIRPTMLLDYLNTQLAPFTMREKHVSDHFRLAGPQVYDAGTVSKASGRPGRLERQGGGKWAGQTFPSFAWQQHHSQLGEFRTVVASWQWPATRIRGWCLTDGRVLPLLAASRPGERAQLASWQDTPYRLVGATLAGVQHPALAALWDQRTDTVAGDVNENGTRGRQDSHENA